MKNIVSNLGTVFEESLPRKSVTRNVSIARITGHETTHLGAIFKK